VAWALTRTEKKRNYKKEKFPLSGDKGGIDQREFGGYRKRRGSVIKSLVILKTT
jgi:hypothetical protein